MKAFLNILGIYIPQTYKSAKTVKIEDKRLSLAILSRSDRIVRNEFVAWSDRTKTR